MVHAQLCSEWPKLLYWSPVQIFVIIKPIIWGRTFIVKQNFVNGNENKNMIISKWVVVDWVSLGKHSSILVYWYDRICLTRCQCYGRTFKNAVLPVLFFLLVRRLLRGFAPGGTHLKRWYGCVGRSWRLSRRSLVAPWFSSLDLHFEQK